VNGPSLQSCDIFAVSPSWVRWGIGCVGFSPGGRYFGCRICYRLTYRSVQEHDKRVDALRRNPAALNAILADPAAHLRSGRALLTIKALRHPWKRSRR
jgi:hypothetical protein